MRILETSAIFGVFFWLAARPAPDDNETHYLCLARHFWDGAFCSTDLLLARPDAHRAFNLCVGWLSLAMPLSALAWTGRVLTWGLLAVAWQRLFWAVVAAGGAKSARDRSLRPPARPANGGPPVVSGLSVIAAAAYVLLQRHTQVAGEWVVGGFEAKGLAYALVFFGIERFMAGRWNLALTLLGAATALHVLVGGWSLVALAFAGGLEGTHRLPARKLILGLAAGAGLALCGLVPALALNWGVPRDVLDQANQIYVYQRLPHHLNPLRFPGAKLAVQLALACLFVLMSFVLGTVAIALVGGGLALATQGYPSVYASLMRYFWFRLSDAMLPLGVVLLATATVAGTLRIWLVGAAPGGGPRTRLLPWAVLAGMISAIGPAWPWRMPALTGPARAERGMQGVELAAWRDVCAWIRANTPGDACFVTPIEAETFKWQAQRGQFVNWKDIPQDARGIVEWKRRIDAVVKTRGKPEALRQLAAEHGVAYVLLGRSEALEGMADYANARYRVYRVTD